MFLINREDHEQDGRAAVEVFRGKIVVMDVTSIKAYSKRAIHKKRPRGSYHDVRVGKNGKTDKLGCKLHILAGLRSELFPVLMATANDSKNSPRRQRGSG